MIVRCRPMMLKLPWTYQVIDRNVRYAPRSINQNLQARIRCHRYRQQSFTPFPAPWHSAHHPRWPHRNLCRCLHPRRPHTLTPSPRPFQTLFIPTTQHLRRNRSIYLRLARKPTTAAIETIEKHVCVPSIEDWGSCVHWEELHD